MRKRKENQRITLTKRLLREALVRLLASKEIADITVSELCKEAGINRTTFYYHYGSQTDVLTELELLMLEDIRKCLTQGEDAADKSVEEQVTRLYSYLRLNFDMAKLLFCNCHVDPEFMDKLFQLTHTLREARLSIPQTAQDRMTEAFLANASYGMIRYWLTNDMPLTPQEVGRLAMRLTHNGWADFYDE